MARALRIDLRDGWYHAMARGTERRDLFHDDRDYEHFLELLAGLVKRYGVTVHAYVLLRNHFPLLVQTPHANLSRAMQWFNVSYGVWFNRRHNRVGPLFQGRFKAVPVDREGAWALQASVYLHLNPVRIQSLGLGKRARKAEERGHAPPPTQEVVTARLKTLRGYRWSSYPAYAGYVSPPAWLTCTELWQRAQRGPAAPTVAYRWQVETPLKAGWGEMETFGARVKGVLAVGSQAFVDRLRRVARGDRRTQPAVRQWQRLLPFARVIALVEARQGAPWAQIRERYGDDGRDAALWLGRRHCGLTLAELGAAAGGVSAVATGAAVRRLDQRRRTDAQLQVFLDRAERQLSESET